MALGNKTLNDLLKPISEHLGHTAVPDSVPPLQGEITAARVTDGLTQEQLVDLFCLEAEKVRVQVKRCTASTLASTIASIVGQGVPETNEPCTVLFADDPRFVESNLQEALEEQARVLEVAIWDESKGQANIDTALTATYGITYATGGIAETGTIIQPTDAHCGRSISLLPLAHIAVIDASTIKATMVDAMKDLSSESALPSQICFISGPSATADIELVRVEGVHGPMYVSYVVVE